VGADAAMPAGTAAENSAVFLAVDVDRAERWRGQRGEHARMGGDGTGNALTAAQPGADELIGVSPVDLGTGRALGGTASLARDGQDPAGLVDGGVAVQQFPGGAVDVIDAATQQNRLQAPARIPSGARRNRDNGQRRTPLVGPLRAAVDERRQAPARRRSIGVR